MEIHDRNDGEEWKIGAFDGSLLAPLMADSMDWNSHENEISVSRFWRSEREISEAITSSVESSGFSTKYHDAFRLVSQGLRREAWICRQTRLAVLYTEMTSRIPLNCYHKCISNLRVFSSNDSQLNLTSECLTNDCLRFNANQVEDVFAK